jgi:hypothetical protein
MAESTRSNPASIRSISPRDLHETLHDIRLSGVSGHRQSLFDTIIRYEPLHTSRPAFHPHTDTDNH